MDEANEALDPETLFSKEYCIGEYNLDGLVHRSWRTCPANDWF